jgi:hypothetical protein
MLFWEWVLFVCGSENGCGGAKEKSFLPSAIDLHLMSRALLSFHLQTPFAIFPSSLAY